MLSPWRATLARTRSLANCRFLPTRSRPTSATTPVKATKQTHKKPTSDRGTSWQTSHSGLAQQKASYQARPLDRAPTPTGPYRHAEDTIATAHSFTWSQILYIGYFVFGCAFILHYVATIRGCWGPSMLPTLEFKGDAVAISLLHRGGRFVKRGDLVSYVHPMNRDVRGVKRVIGLSGDLVLRDTPGEGHGDGVLIRVPEGHCWIVGDNLEWSRDSRHFGPLPLALIRGRVMARVKPWRDRKWFRRTDYVDVPEPD